MIDSKVPSKRATSQDVARLAGVSVTTVSFVVNNKTGGNVRISDKTRQKVWEAVRALNYRPMSAAQALRTKRSNLLALMIPHIETPFQPQFAAAVQREAEKEKLDVIIYGTRNEIKREKDFFNVLISRGVDAVIIHSHNLSSGDINSLVEANIAVVIHGSNPSHPLADNVMLDEIKAAEDVVAYLVGQGHRRIGTIAGPATSWDGRLRRQGYLNAIQAHNLDVDKELIQEADFFKQGAGSAAMQKLLALATPPTAVFVASDLLAVEALLYTIDSGRSVPGDVAIIGFDNTRETMMVRPRLTTVHKDVDLLAAAALRMLTERIHSEASIPARQTIVEHKIIFRESA